MNSLPLLLDEWSCFFFQIDLLDSNMRQSDYVLATQRSGKGLQLNYQTVHLTILDAYRIIKLHIHLNTHFSLCVFPHNSHTVSIAQQCSYAFTDFSIYLNTVPQNVAHIFPYAKTFNSLHSLSNEQKMRIKCFVAFFFLRQFFHRQNKCVHSVDIVFRYCVFCSSTV